MAGSITVQLQTQVLDFGPLTRGAITIKYKATPSSPALDLSLDLVLGPPTTYEFQEVAYIDGVSGEDDQQAANYAQRWNANYASVGGGAKNIQAVASGDTVTITATLGEFESGSNYSGNVLIVGIGAPNNTPDSITPQFTATALDTGGCSVIDHEFVATAGTAPFKLYINDVEQLSSWDGLATTLALVRGAISKVEIEDANNEFSNAQNINVARRQVQTEFEAQLLSNGSSVSITVVNNSPVAGIDPFEYSLDDTTQITGQNYQTSNIFPSVSDGTYFLFIKDKFGCEFKKNVAVAVDQAEGAEILRTFIVSPMQSLSFSKRDTGLKNLVNTLSFEEELSLPKRGLTHFISSDEIQTQFKSSYPFHVVTLFKCDGTKEELFFNQIQQNIGVEEKFDCKTFPLTKESPSDPDLIGVYFAGGNEYEPNTTTSIDASPYDGSLPDWANQVDKFAQFDSLGVKQIKGIGYDSDRNAMYFIVEGIISAEVDDKVQGVFNRHDYNVFRFDFSMSKVSNLAFVRIEAGWSFDEIDQVWQSETIKLLTNIKDFFRIDFEGFKILGDMLFIDGIKGIMWVKGRVRPYAIGEAETYDGETRTYPLSQDARVGIRVTIPLMTVAQWIKFNGVSGISIGGKISINNMEVVRLSPIEESQIGDTNYSEVQCEFAYSSDQIAEKPDEIVYNTSTGVEGSGGSGIEPFVGWEGFERLKLEDDTYLRLEDGAFISL